MKYYFSLHVSTNIDAIWDGKESTTRYQVITREVTYDYEYAVLNHELFHIGEN